MKIKEGVVLDLASALHNKLPVIEEAFGYFESLLTITSGREGVHMEGSKHYTGEAIDCRTRHLDFQHRKWIVQRLQMKLKAEFDVVLEHSHIHIEVH